MVPRWSGENLAKKSPSMSWFSNRVIRLRRRLVTQTRAPRARLRMEMLEGRCLPSTGLTANQEFVSQVYADLLNRSADSAGLAYWSGQLDQGTTRAQVVLGIETSPSNEYQSNQVTSFYQTLLKRSVDAGSVGYWEQFLARHGVEQTEAAICGSPEYFQD